MLARLAVAVVPFCAFAPGALAADLSEPVGTTATTAMETLSGGWLSIAPGLAEVLTTRPGVKTIIIGNPDVVDATVIDDTTVAVTAKAPGTTNIILLDAANAVISRTTVQVGPRSRQVQVFGGGGVQGYNCTPHCSPTKEAPPAAMVATTVMRSPDGTPVGTTTTTIPTPATPPAAAPPTAAPPAQ